MIEPIISAIPYILHLCILICIYIILSTSLNLALGYTGLLNLGHIAFFGTGAYASALLTKTTVIFPVAFISAGIISSMFGLLLILATRKLKGDYLALATLGFNFVVYSLLINWDWLTRGPRGISGIAPPDLFGMIITGKTAFLLFTLIITSLIILFLKYLVKSPFGTLLQATRDDELSLTVLGKNTFALKTKSMMISAFLAGIAGSLYAHFLTFISPSSFMLPEVILLLTIVMAGGIASLGGSIFASIIILLIPEILRILRIHEWIAPLLGLQATSILGPTQQIIYALLLLGILLFRPRGIFGRVDLP